MTISTTRILKGSSSGLRKRRWPQILTFATSTRAERRSRLETKPCSVMERGQINICYFITASASQAIGMTLLKLNFASISLRINSSHPISSISNGARIMLRLCALRKTKFVRNSWAFFAPPARRASLWIGTVKSSQVGASTWPSLPICTTSSTSLVATCKFCASCKTS